MTLVAAFKTLLHRYVGEDDLRVATLVANRNRPGTEHLIGPLANTVILRTCLSGDPSPREVLRGSCDDPRGVRPPGSSFRRACCDARARACSRTSGAGSSDDFVAECRVAPYSERRKQARFRGDQSEYAVASGDGNDIRCYLDASGKRSWAGVYKLHLFRATAIDRLLRDFRKVLERMLTPAGATNVDNPDLRE
jgi:hypothetical protein